MSDRSGGAEIRGTEGAKARRKSEAPKSEIRKGNARVSVARTSSLLLRRLPAGQAGEEKRPPRKGKTRQIGNLRYSRLEACATEGSARALACPEGRPAPWSPRPIFAAAPIPPLQCRSGNAGSGDPAYRGRSAPQGIARASRMSCLRRGEWFGFRNLDFLRSFGFLGSSDLSPSRSVIPVAPPGSTRLWRVGFGVPPKPSPRPLIAVASTAARAAEPPGP